MVRARWRWLATGSSRSSAPPPTSTGSLRRLGAGVRRARAPASHSTQALSWACVMAGGAAGRKFRYLEMSSMNACARRGRPGANSRSSPDADPPRSRWMTSVLGGVAFPSPGAVAASTSRRTRARMPAGQRLGDHAAHRPAQHVGPAQPQARISEAASSAIRRMRERAGPERRPADALVVEGDHPPVLRQRVDELRLPGVHRAREPHDQHQRRALPHRPVADRALTRLDRAHRHVDDGPLTRRSGRSRQQQTEHRQRALSARR